MRLIDTYTLELEETLDPDDYAILSHRWEAGEVSYEQYVNGSHKESAGYKKIVACCSLAKRHGFDWVWVDTCCIDKRSSAELSEAINSMWSWYRDAAVCYAYLSDVGRNQYPIRSGDQEENALQSLLEDFQASAWFTRGWTLQELLAPTRVRFYDCHWRELCFLNGVPFGRELKYRSPREHRFVRAIVAATGIDAGYLTRGNKIEDASVAQRMSWAARRETTRVEDKAYCLLGIFNINMPLLYGEGRKAFIRLQEEIIRHYDDESIFAWWGKNYRVGSSAVSLLATTPWSFRDSGSIVCAARLSRRAYAITNKGLEFEAEAFMVRGFGDPGHDTAQELYIVYLNCFRRNDSSDASMLNQCAIVLEEESGKVARIGEELNPNDIYKRFNPQDFGEDVDTLYPPSERVSLGLTRFYIRLVDSDFR